MKRTYLIAIAFTIAFFAPYCGGFTSPKLPPVPVLDDPFHDVRSEGELNAAISYGRCIVFVDPVYSMTPKVVRRRLLPEAIDRLLDLSHTDVALVRIQPTTLSPEDWAYRAVADIVHGYIKGGALIWYRDGKPVHSDDSPIEMTPGKFVRLTKEHLFGD